MGYQAPVMLGVYGYSLWTQDEELHDMMGSMLSATVITGVSTSVLKVIVNTDRPSGGEMNGHYGFPSYHTASTFAIAAVLDEYYGCKVGLPAYLLAGAVGFSRIDEQDHDLSDVLFGGVLGFVIGKSVAGRHLCGNSEIQFGPYFHPTDGSPGIALEAKF
ncbi:MAG: phosphoesterase pa-phosphatase related protein [Planctomycetota bacterium]|nr:MAG: phosphoesterase pa-phosphatase related protein [Planctomycetota bacterium]